MVPKIVMTKTPLRITFTGGGTDIPQYYQNFGTGASVNSTIDKYIHVIVAKHFYHDIFRISYRATENNVKRIDDIKHPVFREGLRFMGMKGGLQLLSITEVPSQGTGLGSSSSFTVGLLNALHAWKNQTPYPRQLAEEAVFIERTKLKEAGGKQDQYAAAFGGLNYMRFERSGKVDVIPINMKAESKAELQSQLLLLYTGRTRASTPIHVDMAKSIDEHKETYRKMSKIAFKTYRSMEAGDIQEIGAQLHENWLLKSSLSAMITNNPIDKMYEKGIKAGAVGGKLIGAGGGGFMMFLAPPEKHKSIMRALPKLLRMQFKFERSGSKRLYM